MSFLRNIRNNLTTSSTKGGTAQRNSKFNPATPARSIISERTATTPSKLHSTGASERDRSDYGTYGGRRSSDYSRRGSTSTTLRRESKYGRENPAPIIVFVDKYETTKKPAGILRNNTFTKGDREKEQRSGNAISRSDTFTINESESEEAMKTNTYTKRKSKERSRENITDATEKLPVVVDSRTYRKKSLKSSKPVQKVESFIKRFEKSLFGHDSKKNGRKDSNSSDSTYAPTFRDIGINCKLDEEDKLKARKKRQSSRESLLADVGNLEHSSSSQRSYRDSSTTPQNKSRERSTSPTKKHFSTYDRMERLPERNESPSIYGRSKMTHERSSSPFETLELKSKPSDNSYLKARQKEIEMGYSTINKKPSLTLTRPDTPDRNRSVLVNTTRTERYDSDQGRTVTTSTHRVEYNRPTSQFHSNTYNTLKKEYEQANSKPVGIASPRLSSDRPRHERPASPSKQNRNDSADIPKYTFGTNLVERRSRFQEFQKSFRKNDDAEATYQQRFFVPI